MSITGYLFRLGMFGGFLSDSCTYVGWSIKFSAQPGSFASSSQGFQYLYYFFRSGGTSCVLCCSIRVPNSSPSSSSDPFFLGFAVLGLFFLGGTIELWISLIYVCAYLLSVLMPQGSTRAPSLVTVGINNARSTIVFV